MRDHPIPQDITGYQFHIIGNMTIKQFAEILIGVFLAVLFYSSNLIAVIKWPLIGVSIGLGTMMAFVPFEERPLDHWIITFFRVLYKPTKFFWRREPKIPDPFLYENVTESKKPAFEMDLNPARRERIKEYLQSVNYAAPIDQEDLANQQYVEYLMGFFNEVQVASITSQRQQRPKLQVRVRSLREDQVEASPTETVSTNTTPVVVTEEKSRTPLTYHNPLATNQVAQDIAIPELKTVTTARTVDEEASQTQVIAPVDDRAYVQTQTPTQEVTAATAATFNADLPFPSAPTEPNKLVGMVLSPHHELINDAIVEIQNEQGNTVRAVKTNALGQFFVSTPLKDGNYVLLTEKEGMSFQPLSLHLTGTVVKPLEIRSIV
ncbi:MAG TPA: PrgI family protein [Patescibacteria group bacterium]